MKGFYRLLNHEFMSLRLPLMLICLGAVILPAIFLDAAMKKPENIYERFENIYASSGCIAVFGLLFAVLCITCLANIYMNYWGSKSIYTLITLPVSRKALYFSKLAAFVICFLVLIAAQLLSIFIGYAVVTSRAESLNKGNYLMTNGLFLAFVRSGFLRFILPLGAISAVLSFSILLTIVSSIYYGALCERSKRYWGFGLIAAAILIIVYVINSRIWDGMYYPGHQNLYLHCGVLLSLSSFFMWHSIRLIEKSAIT